MLLFLAFIRLACTADLLWLWTGLRYDFEGQAEGREEGILEGDTCGKEKGLIARDQLV